MPIALTENFAEKRLSAREVTEPEAVLRLRSEAALLERLAPLGVTPRLLASGEDERGPWHRIERVRTPILAERIARANGPLPTDWLEHAVRSAFTALATLHDAADTEGPLHVIHGDLSPANLAFDDLGTQVVILDLDLASWRQSSLPRDGAFRGTLDYVAPEVARGEAPTRASDLFGLAASLFHGVLGHAPRTGRVKGEPSFPALLAIAAEAPILREEDRALATRGPGHAALIACLEHDAARRPASATAVAAQRK